MWFYKLNACTSTVNLYFYMKMISGIYTCHYRCGVVNWFHTCPYSPEIQEIIEKKIRPTILPLEQTLFMIKDEPWYDNINSVSHTKTIEFKTRKIFQPNPNPPPKKKEWLFSSFDDDDWHSLSKCRARYRFFVVRRNLDLRLTTRIFMYWSYISVAYIEYGYRPFAPCRVLPATLSWGSSGSVCTESVSVSVPSTSASQYVRTIPLKAFCRSGSFCT